MICMNDSFVSVLIKFCNDISCQITMKLHHILGNNSMDCLGQYWMKNSLSKD